MRNAATDHGNSGKRDTVVDHEGGAAMRRLLVSSALVVSVAVIAVLALVLGSQAAPNWLGGGGEPAQASHNSGVISLLALDMDATGNTIDAPTDFDSDTTADTEQATLGSIEKCISVNHPATFDIDVVVSGFPATDPMTGYEVDVSFPSGLTLTNSITGDIPILARTLISADPQSGSFSPTIDPTGTANYGGGSDLVGPATFGAAVLDFSPLDLADEDIDGEEIIDGYLVRLTISTNANGPALLPMSLGTSAVSFVIDDAGTINATLQDGTVAVDRACPTPADLEKESATIDPIYGCKTDNGNPPPPVGNGTPVVDFRDADADTLVDDPIFSACFLSLVGIPFAPTPVAPFGPLPPFDGNDDFDFLCAGGTSNGLLIPSQVSGALCATNGGTAVSMIDEDPKDGIDNDGDTLIDEDPFGFLGLDNDGDLQFDEGGDDVLDAHVSQQAWFNLTETYQNTGPDAPPSGSVDAVITINLASQSTVRISFHCDQDAIDANAQVDITGDTTPDLTCTDTNQVFVTAQGVEMNVFKDIELVGLNSSQQVVQQFDVHCNEASAHSVTITDSIAIDPSDPAFAAGEGADTAANNKVNVLNFNCIGQSDLKIVDMSNEPLPLKDLDGNTVPEQPFIIIGAPAIDIVVNKTIHNNGPVLGVDATVVMTAFVTGIDWGGDSPAQNVPANCTITGSPKVVQKNVTNADQAFQETFGISCGPSPYFETDDDGDNAFDEDPLNFADDDGDTLIDEDPSFEIALVVVTNSLKPKDPHILDPDPTNNVPDVDNTLAGGGANDPFLLVGPFIVEETFTPVTADWTSSSDSPANPFVPVTISAQCVGGSENGKLVPTGVSAADCVTGGGAVSPGNKLCTVTLGCEMEFDFSVPAGEPLGLPITFVPQATGGTPGGYTIVDGLAVTDGTPIGAFSVTLGIGGGSCPAVDTPLAGTLLDSALPFFYSGVPNDFRSDSTADVDEVYGASDTTLTVTSSAPFAATDYIAIDNEYLQITAVTDGTTIEVDRGVRGTTDAAHASGAQIDDILPLTALGATPSWATALEADPQFLAFNGGASTNYAGAPLHATYTISPPPLGFPVNILVFNLGPGPANGLELGSTGYAHTSIIGDPLGPPSGLNQCSPINLQTTYAGELTPFAADLRVCQDINGSSVPVPFGTANTFVSVTTRVDTGQKVLGLDVGICPGLDNDTFPGLCKDEHVGLLDNDSDSSEGEDDCDDVDNDSDTAVDEDPADEIIEVGLPSSHTVNVLVHNGQSPDSVDVALSAVSGPECSVNLDPAGAIGDPPEVPPTIINGKFYDVISWTEAGMSANEDRIVAVDYDITCSVAGTFTDQIQFVANTSPVNVPEPIGGEINNQAENKVTVTATPDLDVDGVNTPEDLCPGTAPATPVDGNGCSDAQVDQDGDGICDPNAPSSGPSNCIGEDNCPSIANTGQEDADADGDGNVCDDNDDNDGVVDLSDACSPGDDTLAGAGTGQNLDSSQIPDLSLWQGTSGCLELDFGIFSVDKEDPITHADVSASENHLVEVDWGWDPPSTIDPGVRQTLLLISQVGGCEARWIPQPGDGYVEDVINGEIHSLIERVVNVAPPIALFEIDRTYSLHCFNKSDHTVRLEVGIVPLFPVQDPDLTDAGFAEGNVHKQDIVINAFEHSDLKVVSKTIALPNPAEMRVNVPTNIDVQTVLHNNGPYGPAVGSKLVTTITAPPDCSATSVGDSFHDLVVSVDKLVVENFDIECTTPSFHTFTIEECVSVEEIHVHDEDPDNNCMSKDFTLIVYAMVDAAIFSMTAVASTPQEINVPFDITVTESLAISSGDLTSTNVTLTFNVFSLPADCTLDPAGPVVRQVLLTTTQAPEVQVFEATCTDTSNHTFNFENTIALKDEHVRDTGSGPDQAFDNTGIIEVEQFVTKEICSLWLSDTPSPATATGPGLDCTNDDGAFAGGPAIILVAPDTNVTLYENALDYSSDDVNITEDRDLVNTGNGPQDCALIGSTFESDQQLEPEGLSVMAADTTWTINLPSAAHVGEENWCDVDSEWAKDAKDAHVFGGDDDLVALVICGDTDGDTIADFCPNGDLDNCPDIANPLQRDADNDGLGDLCENPGVVIKYCLKFGPAPVNISDGAATANVADGAYLWAICEIGNLHSNNAQTVTIEFDTAGMPDPECTQDDLTILPGQSSFVLEPDEQKFIVFRAGLECHSTTDQVVPLTVTVTLTGDGDDDDDGLIDEDSRDGVDDDGDSIDGEDPPGVDDDIHEQIREVIISNVQP